jgi:hypothetical protein
MFDRNALNSQHPNLTTELALVTTACAALFSQRLQVAAINEIPGAFKDLGSDNHSDRSSNRRGASGTNNTVDKSTLGKDVLFEPANVPVEVSLDRLLMAARMLFDDAKLKLVHVHPYIDFLKNQPLSSIPVPPGTISAILKTLPTAEQESWWSFTRLTTMLMSVLVFAFSHVPQIEACSDLPLHEDHGVVGQSSLSMKLFGWDGRSHIGIEAETSFEVICLLMLGQFSRLDLSQAVLLSHKGWSALLSSFGETDPIEKGMGTSYRASDSARWRLTRRLHRERFRFHQEGCPLPQ